MQMMELLNFMDRNSAPIIEKLTGSDSFRCVIEVEDNAWAHLERMLVETVRSMVLKLKLAIPSLAFRYS